MFTRARLSPAYLCLLWACNGAQGEQSLLERSVLDPVRCEVEAELRDFGFTSDGHDAGNGVVRLVGGGLWGLRAAETEVRNRPRLVVTPLNFSAELGEDVLVDEDGQRVEARALLALPDGGFAVLWIRAQVSQASARSYALWLAAFDAAGASTVGARQLEGVEPSGGSLFRAAVSSSGNIGVLYRARDGSTQLATFDQTGDLRGLTRAGPVNVDALAVAPDGGFVILGHESQADGTTSSHEELLLLKVEESSDSQPTPARVTRPSAGRMLWDAAILPLERGYLVAWTERRSPRDPPWEQTTGGYSIIRIGLLDEHGTLTTAVSLRGPRDSVADRRPVLAKFGELAAVFWSTGGYNYDCERPEACSHQDRGQFLLIDPDALAPRSELTEVLRDPVYPNGPFHPRLGDLLETALSVDDGEVLVTATLEDDDDVRRAPGFAALRCQ